MNARVCVSIVSAGLAMVLLAGLIPAQQPHTKWTAPRTPFGQPNLQGYWTNATYTPLERPVELGTKEFYTPEEAAAVEKQRRQKDASQPANDLHYDDALWQTERYAKNLSNLRTSLVFDPPNGRLPPLSAKGQERAKLVAEAAKRRTAAEKVQDRSLAERCISWGSEGPPMMPSTYNSNLQIIQTESQVIIYNEMVRNVRVVPIDGRPHLTSAIRQLGGDSRGHWEGETLVIDSTNFTDETNFRGPPATTRQDIFSSRDLRVTERFTRVAPDEIVYRFTVDDPSTWSAPWSGEMVLRAFEGPIFEYACHEGNYGLANILSGARAAERAATTK